MAPADALPLTDAAARRAIEFRLDSTLFVEAGAGSGKTTALVSRIVRLIRTGVCALDGLAAVTFTEAAALELRVRVREVLSEVARRSRDGDERRRVAEALDHLDEAAITTIHGFCRRLLTEHPVEAGLPPRIEILDDVARSLAWRLHWSRVLDRFGADEEMSRLVGVASLIGVTPVHLEAIAREVSEAWDRCGDTWPDVGAVLGAVTSAVSRGTAAVAGAVEAALSLADHCLERDDALFMRLDEARELGELLRTAAAELGEATDPAEPLAQAGDPRLAVLASGQPALRVGRFGRREAWDCDIDDVRERLGEVRRQREAALAEVADLVLVALVAAFDVIAREAAADRRAGGRLVFHDLLVLARDLLDDPVVLADVRRTYRCLLVDELQDTDPLQLEIAERIGGVSSAGAAGVGNGPGGRLFFVGDPKQSIYRFRGADPAAYELARERVAAGATTTLSTNFRSVPGILEFANACFPALMGEGYSPLVPARGSPEAAHPPVRLVGGAFEGPLRRRPQRLAESEDCAAAIERAVRTEGWLVADRDGDREHLRSARLSDVAVLVPRRTGLDELEAALDAHGIGYRLESASLIYRTQEVRDLLSLCRAIDDPADQVALLATLRSPAFGCRDDDLYAFRRAGGAWSIESPAWGGAPTGDTGAALVATALETLASYRRRRFELGPIGVLETAVRERRLLQLNVGSTRERESWRRVRFLLERARAFVENGGGGLREFAEWVEEQLSEGLRAVESVLPEPDEDAVHILTVHAAKGLEFPICVLAGFGTTDEIPRGFGRKVLRPPGRRPEVHLTNSLRTAGYEELRSAELELERAEAVRVLYVAVTRARDHLVICAHHLPASGEAPLAQRFVEAAQAARKGQPGLWEPLETVMVGAPGGQPAATSPLGDASQTSLFDLSIVGAPGAGTGPLVVRPPAVTPEDWERWCRDRAVLLGRIGRPRSLRATDVAALLERPAMGGAEAPPPSTPAPAGQASEGRAPRLPVEHRGGPGALLGRAVHAVLQGATVATARAVSGGDPPSPELGDLARAEAMAAGVGDRAGEVESLARAALSSPTVVEAFASGRPHRELYVATTIAGVLLDGYVDLCFEGRGGGWTIVDYKTGACSRVEDVEASAQRYSRQAAAYAVALEDATGRPVTRCVLVFVLPSGHALERVVGNLQAVMAGVRARVAAA